ncbi:hypothetical protein [Actinomadura welshii]|uniref:hypothetical protein n=1 Tax=Actinomadura welshii TaxID=3103817 RepID=UPI0003AD7114|nr:hypothetical protein [Actinomadura madurae]
MLRYGSVIAAAVIASTLAVAASGCGMSADAKARDAFESAVQDVGPNSRGGVPGYCREHLAMSEGECLDVFSNAAAYCPWPDNNMPTILKSWDGGAGRTLRVRGKYRDGTTYTRDVVIVKYQGKWKLKFPYWLDGRSQPPCPPS